MQLIADAVRQKRVSARVSHRALVPRAMAQSIYRRVLMNIFPVCMHECIGEPSENGVTLTLTIWLALTRCHD